MFFNQKILNSVLQENKQTKNSTKKKPKRKGRKGSELQTHFSQV